MMMMMVMMMMMFVTIVILKVLMTLCLIQQPMPTCTYAMHAKVFLVGTYM